MKTLYVRRRVEYIEELSMCTQSITDKFIFFRKAAGVCGVITYGLSDLSRQALSIPGNDIMVSISRLEAGFWLLCSQKKHIVSLKSKVTQTFL